jgi:transposase-like protein
MTDRYKLYSEAFRRQVVGEYEAGSSLSDLRKKYGITGMDTIPRWVQKYGKGVFRHEVIRIQSTDEAGRVRELERRVKELEAALGKMTLEKLKLESILEVLQEGAPDAVKKNERPSFNGLNTKSNKKVTCE